MSGHRSNVYKTLIEVVQLVESNFNVSPIVYGSLGVELALKKDYGARDVDLLLDDQIVNDGRLIHIMLNAGYIRVDKPYLAFIKNDVEVEIATISYWAKEADFIDENNQVVSFDSVTLHVLGNHNLCRLYEYLTKHPQRPNTKHIRDQVKRNDLIKCLQKEKVTS